MNNVENLTPQHLINLFHRDLAVTSKKKDNSEWSKIHFKVYERYNKIPLKIVNKRTNLLRELILKRRSRKIFTKKISLVDISKLLYFSGGIVHGKGDNSRRAYPSGGARYPLELYVLSNFSEIGKGVFHYNVKNEVLEKFPKKVFNKKNLKEIFHQKAFSSSSIIIVITTVIGRSQIKYGLKALKLSFIEAGHLGQNVLLNATDLGYSACPIAGYSGVKLNRLLGIDGYSESSIYAIALG